ncbi:hypothetical protein H8959_001788 [Pygathrix nigripes]
MDARGAWTRMHVVRGQGCTWCVDTDARGAWIRMYVVRGYGCMWCVDTDVRGEWIWMYVVRGYGFMCSAAKGASIFHLRATRASENGPISVQGCIPGGRGAVSAADRAGETEATLDPQPRGVHESSARARARREAARGTGLRCERVRGQGGGGGRGEEGGEAAYASE